MKRRAFTLVEMLVVVAVIALVAAMMLPQLDRARGLARAAVCRSNLHQIGAGFRSASAESPPGWHAPRTYPRGEDWPEAVHDQVPKDALFLCPEDDPGDWDMAPNLEWTCVSTGVRARFVDGFRSRGHVACRSRRGTDETTGQGYTEYVFEDCLPYGAHGHENLGCNFSENQPWFSTHPYNPDWSNNDSVFRLYDGIGSTKRLLRLQYVTCSMDNRAYLYDRPIFGVDDRLINFKGHETYLSAFYTSYGINARVGRHKVGPDTIVALDYEHEPEDMTFIADPDASNVNARLDRSGRHLGRIHVLRADESVRAVYPGEIYPQTAGDAWSP